MQTKIKDSPLKPANTLKPLENEIKNIIKPEPLKEIVSAKPQSKEQKTELKIENISKIGTKSETISQPPKSLYTANTVIQNIEISSEESSEMSDKESKNINPGRNLSSTLASLGTKKEIRELSYSDESSEEISAKPDDVLQTVKFGTDVMQQMRAKRNEILMSHATSNQNSDVAKSSQNVRKDFTSNAKEKTITPTPKVAEPKPEIVEKKLELKDLPTSAPTIEVSYPVSGEFDEKLVRLQKDMVTMIETHKTSIELKVKEIIIAETGELRKEFRQERAEQVIKISLLVRVEIKIKLLIN